MAKEHLITASENLLDMAWANFSFPGLHNSSFLVAWRMVTGLVGWPYVRHIFFLLFLERKSLVNFPISWENNSYVFWEDVADLNDVFSNSLDSWGENRKEKKPIGFSSLESRSAQLSFHSFGNQRKLLQWHWGEKMSPCSFEEVANDYSS